MTETKAKTLERAFKAHALSIQAPPEDVCTALTLLLYDAALVSAVLSDKDPSAKLAEFIRVLEENFGQYLQSPSVVMIRRLGETLFSSSEPES